MRYRRWASSMMPLFGGFGGPGTAGKTAAELAVIVAAMGAEERAEDARVEAAEMRTSNLVIGGPAPVARRRWRSK